MQGGYLAAVLEKAVALLQVSQLVLLLLYVPLEICSAFLLSVAAVFPPERRAKVTAGLHSGVSVEEPLRLVRVLGRRCC